MSSGVPVAALRATDARLCYALRLRSLRVAGALLLAAMTFAAAYLNHHYVVDVVGGYIYALATFALVESVRACGTGAQRLLMGPAFVIY